jgi:2',3'-cyclic-nucleotide 2'-phosphodiesterase/3'-nucleotidase
MKKLFMTMTLTMGLALTATAATAKPDDDASAKTRTVELKIVETSDVHGSFYPYDFLTRREAKGSLARVSSYLKAQRQKYGQNLLLLDNGDILQGQPTAYYYNFEDTVAPHVVSSMLNYLGYDAGNMGNHDVEAGHPVYDRWIGQCRFPVLGANIVSTASGEPYLPPYVTFQRDGVKVAVLGMITPAIPSWLPERLWSGLRFEDMKTCAQRWVKEIQEREQPDVLIGLFHAGKAGNTLGNVVENASLQIAREVPGFDLILMGHDHTRACLRVENVQGDSVWVLNPANKALVVSDVTVSLTLRKGRVVKKDIQGHLEPMDNYPVDEDFMQTFRPQYDAVSHYVEKRIGTMASTISAQDAFFGPSAFIDLIHTLQLQISGADISFCAPLSYNAQIAAGPITVGDMFNLYKFENMLYVMRMTGLEIKNFLEMSYGMWVNQMQTADDHLLLLNPGAGSDENGYAFKYFTFNFDSAAGIQYTVDVTKPVGERIHITSMADGTPFSLEREYRVALNSYRGNGGGDLMTLGAGIPKEELNQRLLSSTDKDLRYYLIEYIRQHPDLRPEPLNQWKFIPEDWAQPAAERDRALLFRK